MVLWCLQASSDVLCHLVREGRAIFVLEFSLTLVSHGQPLAGQGRLAVMSRLWTLRSSGESEGECPIGNKN